MTQGFNSSTGQRLNAKLIFHMLMKRQASSRVELARLSGLTQATISNIINPMISFGLIYEYPLASRSVGRRSVGLGINYDRFCIIHLRIVSGQFSIGRFNLAAKQLSDYVEQYAPETPPEQTMTLIRSYIQKILAEDPDTPVLGIGISLPSPYNNGHYFEQFSELKNWNNVNICDELRREFRLPVFAENDANVGALNEWQSDSSITDQDTLVYLALSTGTSCGIISHGALLRGAQGLAGEIGHMTVNVNGPLCRCGRCGCLELYTSTAAMKRLAQARCVHDTDTILTPACTRANFFSAVLAGDKLAVSIFEEAMDYLSVGIMNMIYLYNPNVIVLGDEMIMRQVGNLILDYQSEKLRAHIRPEILNRMTLRLSSLISDPAFVGAGALVTSHISDILYDYHYLDT